MLVSVQKNKVKALHSFSKEDNMQGNVAVIDGDAVLTSSYKRLFSTAGYTTYCFTRGEDYLTAYPQLAQYKQPDCLILDLQLPGISGLEVQRRLPAEHAPIIFVSAHGSVATTVAAMKSGALDFLEKPVDTDRLVGVVKEAIEKNRIDKRRRLYVASIKRRSNLLTPREYQVLRHIITGRLNKNIGSTLAITEKTVKVHRARVFKKMQVRSVAELSRHCVIAGIEPVPLEVNESRFSHSSDEHVTESRQFAVSI